MKCFYVTGTDTDIGKTTVACQLLNQYNQQGLRTIGLKLIASGCEATEDGLRNDDALKLQSTASVKLTYHEVNPIAFEPPIAPHIAADLAEETIDIDQLCAHVESVKQHNSADIMLLEGIGGWSVPINQQDMQVDLVKALNIPVILVVGMKLGCLNHTLLTAESIQNAGLKLAGWIANPIDPDMLNQTENIATLTQRILAKQIAISNQ